jgi:hypothetical protein
MIAESSEGDNRMSEKSHPQYASVEQPFGCEPPTVHCPVCGNPSMVMGDEGGQVSPCPHLAFIYVGEVGEFEYQSEDFGKRFATIDTEELSLEGFKDALENAGYDNKLLSIEITYGGMGSGPMWFTDVFGFDYGALKHDETA